MDTVVIELYSHVLWYGSRHHLSPLALQIQKQNSGVLLCVIAEVPFYESVIAGPTPSKGRLLLVITQ